MAKKFIKFLEFKTRINNQMIRICINITMSENKYWIEGFEKIGFFKDENIKALGLELGPYQTKEEALEYILKWNKDLILEKFNEHSNYS